MTTATRSSLILSAAAVLLSGCYTQLATVRDAPRDRYVEEGIVSEQESAPQPDYAYDPYGDWWRWRYSASFRFYYPRYYYSYWAYDPFFDPWMYDCYYFYDPWRCGSAFVGRPYWYDRYWGYAYGGYYTPYGYWYPYRPGLIVVASGGTSRTRDSGYRRTGSTSGGDRGIYGRAGLTGDGGMYMPPATRSSGGTREGAATRGGVSTERTRNGDPSYAPPSRTRSSGETRDRGSYTPPARSGSGPRSGSSSPPPSNRGSENTRGSGSTRSRDQQQQSSVNHQPPATTPQPGSSGSDNNRSSGATRSRDESQSFLNYQSPVPAYTPVTSPPVQPPPSYTPASSYSPPPAASGSSPGNRSSGASRSRE